MSKKISQVEEPIDGDESEELAEEEALGISTGELEKEAKRNAHKRKENFRNEISRAAKFLFWIAVLGIASLIFTEIWYLVMPQKWHYITDSQIDKIETILFSGALAAMVSAFSRKYV